MVSPPDAFICVKMMKNLKNQPLTNQINLFLSYQWILRAQIKCTYVVLCPLSIGENIFQISCTVSPPDAFICLKWMKNLEKHIQIIFFLSYQ